MPLLKKAVVSITDACNLQCKHCYNSKTQHVTPWKHFHPENLFHDLRRLGVSQIGFSGGEPLVAFDLLCNILEAVRPLKFRVIVTTNGTLLDEKKLMILKDLDVNIFQVSLDGHEAHIHEILRNPGSFIEILPLFQSDLHKRFNIVPMQVIHKQNYKYLPDFFRFLLECGITSVGFERFIPCGNGKSNSALQMTVEEIREAYSLIYDFESKIRIHINDPLYNIYKLKKLMGSLSKGFICMLSHEESIGCSAFRDSVYIGTMGEVRSCTFTDKILFNLHDTSINEIISCFERNKIQKLKGKCGTCLVQGICRGCRAYAEHYYGDWLEEDPLCFIT